MMRTIPAVLISACLSFFLSSCGSDEGDELQPLDELLGEPVYEDGDGVGSFGASLEMQIAEHLKRFIAEGADPDKSYIIEYHLATDNLKAARKIVEWGKANGFTPVFDESAVVAGEWISVDLLKERKLEVAPLWTDLNGVTSLAETLMCEYDGWGFRDAP